MSDQPVPIWLVRLPSGQHYTQPFDEHDFLRQLDLEPLDHQFRAVSLDRLKYVLSTGVDVEPADSVMWVDCFDKAWEYGGWPKLMMVFDHRALEPSFREVRSDIDPPELESLREDYPTMLESKDGTRLWLSRLPEGDRRVASAYERAYGRWIGRERGNPLRALLIFVRPEDEEAAVVSLA